ncbi:hypothetical protein BLOT_010988 [Blomia tropicalis]|nr:hypothetical protein BLOT_010988 [Blomia tropicalis]
MQTKFAIYINHNISEYNNYCVDNVKVIENDPIEQTENKNKDCIDNHSVAIGNNLQYNSMLKKITINCKFTTTTKSGFNNIILKIRIGIGYSSYL